VGIILFRTPTQVNAKALLREVHAAEQVLACTAQDPMLPTGQPMGTIWAQPSLWQGVQQNRETVTD
jgi:hypothetical protein